MTAIQALLLFCGFVLTASGSGAPMGGSAPAHTRASKAGVSAPQNDAALERAIRARFARSKIAADGFTVRVQGGVTTLEGKTGVIQRKGTATRLARLAGATEVVNRIEVSEAARLRASANLAKGRRRAQVKRSEAGARSEARTSR